MCKYANIYHFSARISSLAFAFIALVFAFITFDAFATNDGWWLWRWRWRWLWRHLFRIKLLLLLHVQYKWHHAIYKLFCFLICFTAVDLSIVNFIKFGGVFNI